MITRQLLQNYEVPVFESKLTAVAFGVFVPFFFIVSGMKLDLNALFATPAAAAAKILLFFVLFLIVRGTPRCSCTETSWTPTNDTPSPYSAQPTPARRRDHRPSHEQRPHAPINRRRPRRSRRLSTLVFPIIGLRIAKRTQHQPAAKPPDTVPDTAPTVKAG